MMLHDAESIRRRDFLAGAGALGCALAMPVPGFAAGRDFRLNMHAPNTGEWFSDVVVADGRWNPEGLSGFARFARDWHRNIIYDMNENVVLIALQIQEMLDSSDPIHLTSGYRSPKTNSEIPGASSKSLHMRGAALDLHHPSRSVSQMHRAAISLQAGGVGKYTHRGFVHIDCGPVRSWGS